jgi:hypothetical protein
MLRHPLPQPARAIGILSGLLLVAVAPRAPAQEARIHVYPAEVTHELSRYTTGACIEDINHEIYGGLYSQMIFGESFQEPAATPGELTAEKGTGTFCAKHPEGRPGKRCLSPFPLGADGVSRLWRPLRRGSAVGRFAVEKAQRSFQPFLGSQSQRLAMIGGQGEVGIENRGLNRWGLCFQAGKPYEGWLWARAERATDLYVALESGDGSRIYDEARLPLPAGGTWCRLDFRLTPSGSDAAHGTGSASGRFAVKLKRPGDVLLGYAFLQPGPWGRFKGLPVRRDIAEALVAQGLTVMRCGGAMVNSPEYRWKEMIGPRDRRRPYRGTWYPYSTNGFGIFDFLDFCEAAGLLGIPDLNSFETPQDMADFLEYANGPADSRWGRRRAADGHPKPYGLKHVEFGNEENVDAVYARRFMAMAEVVWAKNPEVTLVVGDGCFTRPVPPPYRALADEKSVLDFARRHGREIWFDVHVDTGTPRAMTGLDGARSVAEGLAALCPGAKYKVAVFELNAQVHDLQRALGSACATQALERLGGAGFAGVPVVCSANCLQPCGQNDNGWDQGLVFFTPSRVWAQPPYYVTQMMSRRYLPQRVRAEAQSPGDVLDVIAKRSPDGRVVQIQVVNCDSRPMPAELKLEGFVPASGTSSASGTVADVLTLTGSPRDTNTRDRPDRVAPVAGRWQPDFAGGKAVYTFPPYSFTILRWTEAF